MSKTFTVAEIKKYYRVYDIQLKAAALLDPNNVYLECEECDGRGYIMVAKLYPTGHTEVDEPCENPMCNEGYILLP